MKISKGVLLAAGLGFFVLFIFGNAFPNESAMKDMKIKRPVSSPMVEDSGKNEPMAEGMGMAMETDTKEPMQDERKGTMETEMKEGLAGGAEDTMKTGMDKSMNRSEK